LWWWWWLVAGEQEVGAFLDKRVYLDLPLVEGASPVHTEPAGTSASGNAAGARRALTRHVKNRWSCAFFLSSSDIYAIIELLLNNTWRPQLAVTGADGFPAIKSAGNVLRPYTAVKLSIRLPPTADAMKATAAVKELLEKVRGSPPLRHHWSYTPHPFAHKRASDQATDSSCVVPRPPLVIPCTTAATALVSY
jgi:acetylornithine deacetylase/succinyl-diaminopimelate desuccinylase-like protein